MRGRGRGGEMPPELMNLGVIGGHTPVESSAPVATPTLALVPESAEPAAKAAPKKRAGRAPAAKSARAKKTASTAASGEKAAPKAKRPRAKKTAGSTES
jgi:hypothetical protein